MKTNKILIPILTGLLFATAASAQVDITITGSTAFRAITLDRVKSLFDPGYTSRGDATATLPVTFSGTMSNSTWNTSTPLGFTPVTTRLSFSGSAAGMLAVKNSTPIPTIDPVTGFTNNVVPDFAFSDVFPESASPPIAGSAFNDAIVGVVPFVFAKNNALTGITNITREQAVLLMTASGVQGGFSGMPATFLGGSSTNPVYLTGRDSGSGTRITTHKVIGFTGTPTLWGIEAGTGNLIQTNGYSSGGSERVVIGTKSNVIGYLGLSDTAAISASASAISYEGVAYSASAVQTGMYSLWGYVHFVNRVGALSSNQQAVHDSLVGAITNQGYQTTNTLYNVNFVDQANMHVERGTDGGTITSLDF